MFEQLKTKKINIIFFIIIAIGIAYRVLFYSYDRPFWNDECALAFNIMPLNFINFFKPLQFSQAAPPFFMVISGIFYKLMPAQELSLRFFPLISSIASIFIFYCFCRKILNKKSTILLALILFCFNYRLIYYAQEFKQYSSDILIFLGILTSYFYLDLKTLNVKKLVLAGCIYAGLIWVSFTSLFALVTIFIMLFFKNKTFYKNLTLLILPSIISVICFYIFQHHLAANQYLLEYWKDGFIKHNFSNFFTVLTNYFAYGFNSLIIFFFFVAGLVLKLLKIKDEKSLIILIPVFLALVVSYLNIYPLESRVSLYLIPIGILFAVQIIDYINFKSKILNYVIYSLLIFVLSFPAIINSTYKLALKDYDKEDIMTPLLQANKMMKAGDVLYIPDGSELSYNFYKNRFNFKTVIIEKQRVNDTASYLNLLEKLPKDKTYYYVFCHFPNKKQRLISVYQWAKNKKDFKIFADKYYNSLVIFTQ